MGRGLVVKIDGSMGEGGGQILRVSTALSTILRKSIRIYNIRARRSPPGIRPQHKTALEALAKISNASLNGLRVGSMSIEFFPRELKGGSFYFDTGTAGSVSLILQSLIPAMTYSGERSSVELRGGTNNPFAPPIDYLGEVLLPTLSEMGVKASIHLIKRGFYPRGGGIVKGEVEPAARLKPIVLKDYREVKEIYGLAYSSMLPCHIVERMARSARKTLEGEGYKEAVIGFECLQSKDEKCATNPGTGIVLFAKLLPKGIIGSDSLGRIGKPAEEVGRDAAISLIKQLSTGAPVDKFLGDQLIIYMALASGRSTIRVGELTEHMTTCISVCKIIAGVDFEVIRGRGKPTTVTCEGLGLVNKYL